MAEVLEENSIKINTTQQPKMLKKIDVTLYQKDEEEKQRLKDLKKEYKNSLK